MKNTYLIISALVMMCTMSSCAFVDATCGFFTTSWGTELKRNLSETYGKMESKQLADMIDDPAVMNDKDAGKQLLVELGKRDDVKNLSAEQKDNVLNLMVNSSVSTESVAAIVSEISNANGSSDMGEVAKSILSQIEETDTAAVVQILKDVEKLPEVSGSSACLAVVCVVAQVAKNSNAANDTDKVMTTIKDVMGGKTVDDAATELGITGDDKDALQAAIDAASKLQSINAEILPGVKISDLFGAAGA